MTNNFTLKEFESNDGSEMPSDVYLNIVKLAGQLQFLRDYTGKAIKINSGYRSPEYNAKIGGVKNSQHLLGKAADIRIEGMKPKEVHSIIEELISKGDMLQGGLGLYSSFVHYDFRGRKARWDFSKR